MLIRWGWYSPTETTGLGPTMWAPAHLELRAVRCVEKVPENFGSPKVRAILRTMFAHAEALAILSATGLSETVIARLRAIRLLCLDVDGVLSDGHLYFSGYAASLGAAETASSALPSGQGGSPSGVPNTALSEVSLSIPKDAQWTQRFSVRDGVGIKLLQQAGIQVAILSEGALLSGRARAQSLKIEHAYFGLSSKVETFHVLLAKLGLTAAQAAFVGDEVSDLPLLREVAFSATVPDAVAQVRAAVHYVTQRPGGAGAVREVADMIRAAQA